MAKFVLVFVTALLSVAVASPVLDDDLPEIDWMKYAKEGAARMAESQPKPKVQPINWHNYGSGGFVNLPENDKIIENTNKFVPDEKRIGGIFNGIGNNVVNAGNNFLPKPEEQPIDWNKLANEGNLNTIGNNVANAANNLLPKPGQSIDWNKLSNDLNLNNVVGNNQVNKWNVNVNAEDDKKYSDCEPTEDYKDSEGMKEWCLANCMHKPSFCPESHCRCW